MLRSGCFFPGCWTPRRFTRSAASGLRFQPRSRSSRRAGDAPTWTARAEGLKRFAGGRTVNADPWRLFPDWFRANIALPPGTATPKARYLELLNSLQLRPPLWVRPQGPNVDAVWDELKEAGLKPWIHRRLLSAAKLETDADVYHLAPFTHGRLEIQDIASQAVALICDPEPGERWWDALAAGGSRCIWPALMQGKGVVVATDVYEKRLAEAVRRRRSPYPEHHNEALGRHRSLCGRQGQEL